MAFWREEILPWLMRYSTTPSSQWDAEGMLLLDAFALSRAQDAVEREWKRCAAIIERDSQAPRRATYGELKARIESGETP
jgi:hypothetical protein